MFLLSVVVVDHREIFSLLWAHSFVIITGGAVAVTKMHVQDSVVAIDVVVEVVASPEQEMLGAAATSYSSFHYIVGAVHD